MYKKYFKKVVFTVFILFFTLGFRTYPGGNNWGITSTDSTIWVKFCSNLTFSSNDLPTGDVLAGATPTFDAAVAAVLDGYDNVTTSFVTLAPYPTDPNNPPAAATGDSTFTIAKASTRTIDVCFDSSAGSSAGYSQQTWSGTEVTGCSIKLSPDLSSSVKNFSRLLAHEIGHCLGLTHSHESSTAIMSYFSTSYRLQDDDKAGLTLLYPQNPSYSQESATFGLACTPKD
jgi:hypothetical protein